MRFTARPVRFGRKPGNADEDTDGLPTPARIKLLARRQAGIAEARAVLEHLPGPAESLHAVVTARLDLTDVINALLERLGQCERMRIATLGYNARNLKVMLSWLDAGSVASLSLVASIFFRSHNGELWEQTIQEFPRSRARCRVLSFPCQGGDAGLCFGRAVQH